MSISPLPHSQKELTVRDTPRSLRRFGRDVARLRISRRVPTLRISEGRERGRPRAQGRTRRGAHTDLSPRLHSQKEGNGVSIARAQLTVFHLVDVNELHHAFAAVAKMLHEVRHTIATTSSRYHHHIVTTRVACRVSCGYIRSGGGALFRRHRCVCGLPRRGQRPRGREGRQRRRRRR